MTSAPTLCRIVLACVLSTALLAQAEGPHEHGAARLEVARDGGQLTLRFESPLDNLVGFEHLPRNARENQAMANAEALLRDGPNLFRPPAAAQCRLEGHEVELPGLDGPDKVAPQLKHGEGHLGAEASWRYLCANPAELRELEVGVFKRFPRLKRVEALSVDDKGQARQLLTPAQASLKLSR